MQKKAGIASGIPCSSTPDFWILLQIWSPFDPLDREAQKHLSHAQASDT
jgi:hypothetical protein